MPDQPKSKLDFYLEELSELNKRYQYSLVCEIIALTEPGTYATNLKPLDLIPEKPDKKPEITQEPVINDVTPEPTI